MILEVYSVHDAAVGAFNAPLFFRSRGEAVRSFQNAVTNEASQFRDHAADYSFWKVGLFDDSNGYLTAIENERVCGASDFVVAS